MYYEVTPTTEKEILITTSGEHVFYCHNSSTTLTITLATEDAHVYFYGLYTAKEKESFSLNLTLHHTAPHTASTALIKSLVDDEARFTFTGMIRIAKNALHSCAHLTNNNILLSPKAHVITLPQLEVVPNEVTCTHAANTLPIDTEQITYLMNRGLSEEEARALLIDGFKEEILIHKADQIAIQHQK